MIVDWEKGASAPDYFKASSNAVITGIKLANFITENNINPMDVHCIGHSLGKIFTVWGGFTNLFYTICINSIIIGAQVCGFTGKVVKLKRISGLGGCIYKQSNFSLKFIKNVYV